MNDLAQRRAREAGRALILTLRARGHKRYFVDATDNLTHMDGIRVPCEIRPADPEYRWVATDQTFIQVGSLAWGWIRSRIAIRGGRSFRESVFSA